MLDDAKLSILPAENCATTDSFAAILDRYL
jgi:hypothetical protein